jgi:hypothetical protein
MYLPLLVEMPEPFSFKPGQPTGTQFALAAAIGAVWATFNSLTPKSRRALAEMAAELIGNRAGLGAGAVDAVGDQDVPSDTLNAIKLPDRQTVHAKWPRRPFSKPSRVLH